MIGSLYSDDNDDPKALLSGSFYRFVELDPDEPWFNSETGKEASDEEVKEIKIPAHLLPHLRTIPFVFDPTAHQLWFVKRDRKTTLGPLTARIVMEKLISPLVLKRQFPEIAVTSIPDFESLKALLALPELTKIVMDLRRPNGDDADDKKWMKRLEKQKAKRMKVELDAASHESIEPDEETRELAEVAARNGSVSVVGRDAQGRKVEDSTTAKPLITSVPVDEAVETVMDVLRREAGRG